MQRAPLLVAMVFASVIYASHASPFLEDFERLTQSGNAQEIQTFLNEAAESEQANPDYYAKAGNYWWQLSRSVNISTKQVEGDDFIVQDKATGKEAGSISTLGATNPEIPKKAVAILSEGFRRFPHRADIALGLAHVQREMGLQSQYVETFLNLLAIAGNDPDSLRWTNNEHLPSAAGKFIPEVVQGYSARLFQQETPNSDILCEKLCDATIQAFPDHPLCL